MKLVVDEEENVDNNVRSNYVSFIKLKRFNGFFCYVVIVVIIFFLIGKSGYLKFKCCLLLILEVC